VSNIAGTPYADLADLPEDERIRVMAEHACAGNVVACVTDDDDEKAARYIQKMEAHGARWMKTDPGPVPETRTLSFGPPLDS